MYIVFNPRLLYKMAMINEGFSHSHRLVTRMAGGVGGGWWKIVFILYY